MTTSPKDLEGRKALITGSATGLGRTFALKLAERGADIIVNCTKSVEEAEKTVELCNSVGAQTQLVVADVSKQDECQKLAEAAARWGHLDILINNAGTTKQARNHGDIAALSSDDFLHLYAVNVVGPYMMVRYCRDYLEKAAEITGRASCVLNVSSIAGVAGLGSSVAYAASKGALNTMTLSLARALVPNIRVNAVCPGFIGTRWFKDAMSEEDYARMEAGVAATMPLKVTSGPEDIADAAIMLVTDASRHITGEMLIVDAGMHLDYAPMKPR